MSSSSAERIDNLWCRAPGLFQIDNEIHDVFDGLVRHQVIHHLIGSPSVISWKDVKHIFTS